MRKLRATILAGGAALLAAGTAQAAMAEANRMNVALPDGSVAQIEYTGEISPTVTVMPAPARTLMAFDPFAGFERIMAAMEARHRAMMLQMAALERAAAQGTAARPDGFTLVGNVPAGVSYTYVSTTRDASGCTRTVEYRSDGSSQEPRVTRASAGNCDAGNGASAPIPAEAVAPANTQQVLGERV